MKLNISNKATFTKKLYLLPDAEQGKVNKLVSKLSTSFENGKSFFDINAYQPYRFPLKNNLESSLYAAKVSSRLGLIFSIDEDPVFNQLHVTLFDLTDKDKEEQRFKKIGEILYKSENLLS